MTRKSTLTSNPKAAKRAATISKPVKTKLEPIEPIKKKQFKMFPIIGEERKIVKKLPKPAKMKTTAR